MNLSEDELSEEEEGEGGEGEKVTTVFVGGIPLATSRGEVRQFFKSCGRIQYFSSIILIYNL